MKVAVLMGGVSAEREISLKSGEAVLTSLKKSGVDAFRLDLKDDAVQQIVQAEFDIAFLTLHGRGGEDGCIQGVLEWLGKPYTGSGVMASAIAMDKYKTKQIWSMGGLYTPKSTLISSRKELEEASKTVTFPVMIKAIHEGSSIGIVKAHNKDEFFEAYNKVLEYDKCVMVEEFIEGDEYTVSIISGHALPVVGMVTPNDFYDYNAKYQSAGTIYNLPSGLDNAMEERLKLLSKKAYALIGSEGWGRVDIIIDKSGMPWLIEINTCPGMTERSLVPRAAQQEGIDFDSLVLSILNSASLKALRV